METIRNANSKVQAVIGAQRYDGEGDWRPSRFRAEIDCPDGRLLYHSMTGELLLLGRGESPSDPAVREALARRWFLVPGGFDEKQHCDQLRTVVRMLSDNSDYISHYVVFTTTDCNARCYYCFENGQRRISMTEQTARDAAAWMLARAKGRKIKIRWFGGEPLFNAGVIDLISQALRDHGAAYESTMFSNAYLFDAETARKAAELWKLRHVVVTVDGTEAVYKRVKAFIYQDENPYCRVMSNMEGLLDAGIGVTVNLNMDARNAADLLKLADELGQRFGGKKGFDARCYLLHEYQTKIFSFDSDAAALEMRRAVNERLETYGIRQKSRLRDGLRFYACMADGLHSATILPDGRIGRCEHYGDSEEVGSIYREAWDEEKLAAWRETYPGEEACESCLLYPQCLRLKKCNINKEHCNEFARLNQIGVIHDRMLFEWETWKNEKRKPQEET